MSYVFLYIYLMTQHSTGMPEYTKHMLLNTPHVFYIYNTNNLHLYLVYSTLHVYPFLVFQVVCK